MIKIAYPVDLSQVHQLEILAGRNGQIQLLVKRQSGTDVNFLIFARIDKFFLGVTEEARGNNLEKEKNGIKLLYNRARKLGRPNFRQHQNWDIFVSQFQTVGTAYLDA